MAPTWVEKYYTPDVKEELRQILHVAWPLIMASLWSYLLSPISLMFCGHLGTTVLDGVSLAGSLINISGISIVTGLSAACDTFFSQTYGSGNHHQLGIYLQRSILIISLSMLPCWAFQINAEAFLKLLGQDEVVSRVAAEYLQIFLIGLPGCFAFILLSKYLQNQDILYPTIIIGAIGNGLNALLHYILIYVVNMSFDGSAIAMAVSFDLMGIMSAGYIIIWKVYEREWAGWGRHSVMEWGPFMRLGVPSLIMICVESWTIEVGVFLSGSISIIQQSSQSVLFQIQTITDMLTIGFGSASSIRIGQHLGRGDYAMAKTSAILCLIVTVCIASLVTAIIAGLSWQIPLLFTEDAEVIPIVANLLPVLGGYAFADALSATSGGIVRGCGRQVAGSVINIIGYYGLALPIGIPLMLQWRIIDPMWYSLFGALCVTSVIYLILIIRTNWEEQAKLAAERVNVDEDTEKSKAELLISSFSGRRKTWATVTDDAVASQRQRRMRHSSFGRSLGPDGHHSVPPLDGDSVGSLVARADEVNFNNVVNVRPNSLGEGSKTSPQQPPQNTKRHRNDSNNEELESSFYSTLENSTASRAAAEDEDMDETTGLLSGTKKGGKGKKALEQIKKRLDRPTEGWGLSGRELTMLIVTRMTAILVCIGILAASIALRVTIFNYPPIQNGNLTTFPIYDGNTTTFTMTASTATVTLTTLDFSSTSPSTEADTTTKTDVASTTTLISTDLTTATITKITTSIETTQATTLIDTTTKTEAETTTTIPMTTTTTDGTTTMIDTTTTTVAFFTSDAVTTAALQSSTAAS